MTEWSVKAWGHSGATFEETVKAVTAFDALDAVWSALFTACNGRILHLEIICMAEELTR